MYKCSCCESLIPFTYTNCPVCGNTLKYSKANVKVNHKEEKEEELSIDNSNLVVSSDMTYEDYTD